MPSIPEIKSQLSCLADTLALLLAQTRASSKALPPEQVQARLALAVLERLAQDACNEAQDLVEQLEPAAPGEHPLSRREMEVLRLAADGLTNKEIAYRLGLSERTVQYHLNSVFQKMSVNSRTEATAAAFKQGWL